MWASTFGGWGGRGKGSSLSEISHRNLQRASLLATAEKTATFTKFTATARHTVFKKESLQMGAPECFWKIAVFSCSHIP